MKTIHYNNSSISSQKMEDVASKLLTHIFEGTENIRLSVDDGDVWLYDIYSSCKRMEGFNQMKEN